MPTVPITNICDCPICGHGNYNFCGSDTVESEICFVPGVAANAITVEVDVDPTNFQIELICCNLIVVCGFITKRVLVTPTVGTPFTKTKDIPVQIKVPAEICDVASLTIDSNWSVTGVEVCTGCYALTCPTATPDEFGNVLYHKLIEKDIIGVQVDRLAPIAGL